MKKSAPSLFLRRQALAALGGGLLMAAMPCVARQTANNAEHWVSAQGDSSENFALGWVKAGSSIGGATFTGFRGHAVLQHPRRQNSVVTISRRPGNRAVEIDLTIGSIVGQFTCAPGRHLFGHGCFSLDGQVLYVTEGDVDTGHGRIVVRDADNYQIVDDWPSYGVGPHDIRLLPSGNSLVVANGGILTKPESGRKPLNLETMRSSLSYIDATSGELLADFSVDEPKSSIRHLDVASDGTVAFAMQLQREAAGHERTVPLTGIHRPTEQPTVFSASSSIANSLNDYVGSVAVCNDNRIAGFTSPRGNVAVFWNIDNGRMLAYHRFRDVCGIAVSSKNRAFLLSNSFGEIRELDAVSLKERRERRVKLPEHRWDNHLLVAHST